MSDDSIKIIDPLTRKYLDLFGLVLMTYDKYGVIPEMFRIFGEDKVIKFLDVFAGTVIRVPSRADLELCVRDVDIYITIKDNKGTFEGMAEKYSVSKSEIREFYNRVNEILQSINLEKLTN